MSSAIHQAQMWLLRRLTEVDLEKVYFRVAPQDVEPPFIVYHYIANREDSGVRSQSGTLELLFEFKVFGYSEEGDSPLALGVMETTMHAALVNGAAEVIEGCQIFGCWREEVLSNEDSQSEARWPFVGGVYVVQVHPPA